MKYLAFKVDFKHSEMKHLSLTSKYVIYIFRPKIIIKNMFSDLLKPIKLITGQECNVSRITLIRQLTINKVCSKLIGFSSFH